MINKRVNFLVLSRNGQFPRIFATWSETSLDLWKKCEKWSLKWLRNRWKGYWVIYELNNFLHSYRTPVFLDNRKEDVLFQTSDYNLVFWTSEQGKGQLESKRTQAHTHSHSQAHFSSWHTWFSLFHVLMSPRSYVCASNLEWWLHFILNVFGATRK